MTEGKIPSVEEVIATKEKRLFDELKEKLFDTKLVENQSDEVAAKETEADAQNDSQPDSDAQIAPDAEETVKTLKPWLLNERFTALASELCKNQESEQVVSALLSILYGDKLSPKHYGKINSKEFESSRVISNHSYHKNGSYFIIRQIDDFQNKPKLKQRGKILK